MGIDLHPQRFQFRLLPQHIGIVDTIHQIINIINHHIEMLGQLSDLIIGAHGTDHIEIALSETPHGLLQILNSLREPGDNIKEQKRNSKEHQHTEHTEHHPKIVKHTQIAYPRNQRNHVPVSGVHFLNIHIAVDSGDIRPQQITPRHIIGNQILQFPRSPDHLVTGAYDDIHAAVHDQTLAVTGKGHIFHMAAKIIGRYLQHQKAQNTHILFAVDLCAHLHETAGIIQPQPDGPAAAVINELAAIPVPDDAAAGFFPDLRIPAVRFQINIRNGIRPENIGINRIAHDVLHSGLFRYRILMVVHTIKKILDRILRLNAQNDRIDLFHGQFQTADGFPSHITDIFLGLLLIYPVEIPVIGKGQHQRQKQADTDKCSQIFIF